MCLCWWLCFPLAEELWLRDQYGGASERYAESVPRFVGRETFRALVARVRAETTITRT